VKLLFALPGFHLFDRGAEIALLSVAAELAKDGQDVTVAGSGPARSEVPYSYIRVPSVRREKWEAFPKFPPFRSETAWEDAAFAASLLLRTPLRDYDATITCAFPFTHWALRKRGNRGPAHIFVTQNGDWPAHSEDAEFRSFSCDGLVCTNPDYFERNKERWRCALIPNGIDLARFRPGAAERERLGLPSDRPVILMVSALIETKRVLDGIRAVAQLPEALLVVAGDGPLRADVTDLANQLLPGRFQLASMPASEMPNLYRSVDVFLHLSLLESFGNVFLEAWACGLAIVAHNSERSRWILGNGQFLCDTTNEAELLDALRSALSGSKARSRVGIERFSWRVVADQYRQFIATTAAARRASSTRK
jgi:glycosyltransferase involved in cell wall biosynthesis